MVSWDEARHHRDRRGRFSRIEFGEIPSTSYLAPDVIESAMAVASTNDLGLPERLALREYAGLDGSDYINSHLRGKGVDAARVNQATKLTEVIDGVLERHPTQQELWVTRAATPEAFNGKSPNELVGSSFEDLGFMSTTLMDDMSADFSSDKSKYPVLMRLKVPEGTPSYYVSNMPSINADEQELLLGRGRKVDITGVREMEDGRWEVFADVREEDSSTTSTNGGVAIDGPPGPTA